ncbi:NAD(P)-dependent dehydrogenase, short-chain alcohol dehydrogenase family [Selenomonas sp. GACV-9]|uniref:SDR family NAD(P)-dependent oxidoreductase n=1 Tax=Selenomonas sp. GACV-9 TaxID=3158782 RepID=UPI0008E9D2DC|nr:NAD(P)-dependent dehydrogenase, short-chain alcohol dehydrogenase family [Selenomonas ruminantium]
MNQVSFDFSDCRFAVTGASSGMGQCVARELAEAGAQVLAIARREEKLRELQKEYPEQITIAAVDVCNKKQLSEAVREFVQDKGKLNGGIHAAGIVGITPLKQYDLDMARRIMDVSFWAGVDFLQVCTKTAISEKGASFVLFSSVDAMAGWKGKFAYSGAKMAVNSAVKSIAKEIARRSQRVNSILPGWVQTNMTEEAADITDMAPILQRELLGVGKPEDVTGQVLFLLSDRASWITGTNVVVDGGYLA